MNKATVTLALCLLGLHIPALAKPPQTQQVHQQRVQQLQGVWWERCDDPAAALAIRGDRYAGDFVGEHPLKLTQRRGHPPLVTFTKGLPFGHSVHVSGRAESFEVVKSTGKELVLSPMPGASRAGDWTLSACPKLSSPPQLQELWPSLSKFCSCLPHGYFDSHPNNLGSLFLSWYQAHLAQGLPRDPVADQLIADSSGTHKDTDPAKLER